MSKSRAPWLAAVSLAALLSLGIHSCGPYGLGSFFMFFVSPLHTQLSLPGDLDAELFIFPLFVDPETLVVQLDGAPLDPASWAPLEDGVAVSLASVGEGRHVLHAMADADLPLLGARQLQALTVFDIVDLERPDECEILNSASCALPFPSSRFLVDAAGETESGLRMEFPEVTLTGVLGPPLSPEPLRRLDGYSPTVQILMNFPQGVSLEASGAAVLLDPLCCGQSQTPPYVGVRTHDGSSLDADSPTVLIDAETGERLLHWVELDAHAVGDPARQTLFLRPGASLVPERRYIVAARGLVDPDGNPVEPELTFRALRDPRPSTIPALEARRADFEDIFARLEAAGVAREDLQLAFDFQVRSEKQLTERLLFMRDDALAWLGAVAPGDVSGFDQVTIVEENDCGDPGESIWRHVSGTFAGPNYMTGNIDVASELSFMSVDENDMPVRDPDMPVFPFVWDVAVPCAVYDGEPGHPLLLGHGFLGEGSDMVSAYAAGGFFAGDGLPYVAGATDWRGLSRGIFGPDALYLVTNVIGLVALGGHQFNNFASFPDRLKQGIVNSLVLSRMLKSGFFNRLPEFQRTPGVGVMPVEEEMFYFGVSLGGIYGSALAAFSQDIERFNVDVPAMNFSILEQRSTQFPVFLDLINALRTDPPAPNQLPVDPVELALLLGIQHELWVSAEPAAYVRNITGAVAPPLPNTPPKKILMTVAFLDKQVSNNATEIMARSMGLPNLVGSVQAGLSGIPDVADGPAGLDSALVVYDTGYFDVFDPAYDPFVPPLANQIPSSKCDPHGGARLSIPASADQLAAFLQPGGSIYNFCDGICDAQTPVELPASDCDPLAP